MAATGIATSIELENTRRRVARWRETRTHRGAPMPAALWAAAVALARQHGLYLMARALRVDYGALKKRMDAAGAGAAPRPHLSSFPPRGRPGSGRA